MADAIRSENPQKTGKWDLIIAAGKTERHYWKDLWRYRELFWFLSWRDMLVRYKQTAFGIAWSILRPLLTMVAFSIIFGRVAKLPSNGLPYPILVFAAMIPWQFFSNTFTESSGSLVASSSLISKVYFPRMIVPVSKVLVGIVDFGVSFVIFLALMLYFQVPLTWRTIAILPLLLLAFMATMGPALLISSMNVRYRDFKYVVPFIVQFGLYISPVGFSSSVVPTRWRLLYSLNPLVGVIDGFRWALTGKADIYVPGLVASVALSFLLLVIGVAYFRRTERTFADLI